jgi:uncharacterized protein (TIGR03067 family)
MVPLVLTSALALPAFHAGDAKQKVVEKELKRLQGEWREVPSETDRKKERFRPLGGDVEIRGDWWLTPLAEKATLKLDPTKRPKMWVRTIRYGFRSGETHREWYELRGDELRVGPLKARGSNAAAAVGGVRKFRRLKPDPEKQKAVEEELKRLDGAWDLVATGGAEKDGDPKEIGIRFIFSGGTYRLEDAGLGPLGGGTIRVDPTRSPKALDLIDKDGRANLAIYELRGDELRWCMANWALPRPTKFAQKEKWSYWRLRRREMMAEVVRDSRGDVHEQADVEADAGVGPLPHLRDYVLATTAAAPEPRHPGGVREDRGGDDVGGGRVDPGRAAG